MKPLIVPFFISHQGCPHQCVFCDQERISGQGSGLPSTAEILETIERFAASGGGRPLEAAFYGGTFTSLPLGDQDRLLAPLQPLIAHGRLASVRLSTRPDAVGDETARFLAAHGVTTVELGVQSMDDGVLESAGRGHGATHVERAFASLRGAGLAVGAQLMPGLPGDTPETSLESLDRVLVLGPACVRIYPTVVLAGTRLAELWRSGSYSPLGLDDAVSLCGAMLRRCLAASVPVIRIGLQPTEELERPGTVLAGPWHPAFRQLVESGLFRDLLERLVMDVPAGSVVEVACSPRRISDVAGQHRCNLSRLREKFGIVVRRIFGDNRLPPYDLEISYSGKIIAGSVLD